VLVRSVRYAINCEFPARSSVLGWVVGLAVAAVLLVAVGLFVFYRCKQQRGEPVSTEVL
jgi:hypothetical protein